MEFKELLARAKDIRDKYDVANKEMYGVVWTGEQVMEGFVGDVGALMKLIMAKQGYRQLGDRDIDKELAHELSDCLWCVLVLASKYNVDLEKEFLHTMDYLDERIAKREKH
jgi:NTP pyrophosphatase (non-canonical NTP hydrolase)